jgi:alanyl-tRNA synthetase
VDAALKQVVDPGIGQAGSLVDFERLRFDFHCPRAVTPEELEQIEALINGWIAEAHSLVVKEMAIEQAKAAALAAKAERVGNFQLLVARLDGVDGAALDGALEQARSGLREALG